MQSSQQPYLLRAIYEWCVDNGHTPYVLVRVDSRTQVPMAFVKDGQIVLNVGPGAVRGLHIDNEWISFSARFGGQAQDILVPVGNAVAIYSRETGEGMSFPEAPTEPADSAPADTVEQTTANPEAEAAPERPKGRPQLKIVK